MNRRQLLSGLTAGLAGCAGLQSDDSVTERATTFQTVACEDESGFWHSFQGGSENTGARATSRLAGTTVETVHQGDEHVRAILLVGSAALVETSTGLYRLELDTGTVSWRRENVEGVPAVTCGVVAYQDSVSTYGLDVDTGELVWKHKGGLGNGSGIVTPRQESFVVVDRSVAIRSYDATTGEANWTKDYPNIFSGTAVTADSVFATSGANEDNDTAGMVLSLSPSDGSERWRYTDLGSCYGLPSVGKERVFAVDRNFDLVALDRDTGELDWKHRLPRIDRGNVTPVVPPNSDVVCVTSYETESVIAVDRQTGKERWSRDVSYAIRPPIADGESVYVSSEAGIHSVSLADGSLNWRVDDASATSFLTLGETGLYFGSGTKVLRVT